MIIPWLVISLWYPELTMTIPWLMNHVHNVMYWWLYTLVLSPLSQYHWQAWHPLSLRKTLSISLCNICKNINQCIMNSASQRLYLLYRFHSYISPLPWRWPYEMIRSTYLGSSGCGRAPSLLLGIWQKCKNLTGWIIFIGWMIWRCILISCVELLIHASTQIIFMPWTF